MRKFKYKGELLTLTELMEFSSVRRSVLSDRLIKLGWGIDRALNAATSVQVSKGLSSKHTVDAEISREERKVKDKIKEVGMFATCSARCNAK